MGKKKGYYTFDKLIRKAVDNNCRYLLSVGKRSNGKTFQSKKLSLTGDDYISSHSKTLNKITGSINSNDVFIYIRRWEKDFKGKNGRNFFDDIVNDGWLKKWSSGKYTNIIFKNMTWYLCYINKEGKEVIDKPFMYAVSITNMEHDKSSTVSNVKAIFFDEFLTRNIYLYDEFIQFSNVLSTYIRNRKDIPIFMMANTVSWDSPYFKEMGLTNVKKMTPGQIDIYNYGDSGLSLAIEYIDSGNMVNESNVYFAFNNPKLNMIKNGEWETESYPHAPFSIDIYNTKYTAYLTTYNYEFYALKIVKKQGYNAFIFIHPINNLPEEITRICSFSLDVTPSKFHEVNPLNTTKNGVFRIISDLFKKGQVYYADNTTGEDIRNYLISCNQN